MDINDTYLGLKDKYESAWNSTNDIVSHSRYANNKRGVTNKNIKSQRDAYSYIDTAMTILEKLPEFNEYGPSVSYNLSYTFTDSPLLALITILTRIGITIDDLKNWITDFLIGALPTIEIGVKASLLANLKGMVACASDPRIPKWMRKQVGSYYFDSLIEEFTGKRERERGINIPISAIDPKNILSKSPYSKEGWQFYYGVKGAKNIANTKVNTDADDIIISAPTPTYKLVRAKDFNAFLWYTIHKGQFASPTNIEFDNEYEFTYPASNMKYRVDTSKGGKTILAKMVIMPQYTDAYTYDKIALGQTFTVDGMTNMLGMCYSKKYENGTEMSDFIIPVSSDWHSVNWYVSTNDIPYNVGLSYDDDIESIKNERGLCNIEYMNPNYKSDYYASKAFHGLKFTILPKPYVYVPYVKNNEKLWRIERITFDSNGNPDPHGHFSLPTDLMTSSGTPYVHNDNVKSNKVIVAAYLNDPANKEKINGQWQEMFSSATILSATKSEEEIALEFVANTAYTEVGVEFYVAYQALEGADLTDSGYSEEDRQRALRIIALADKTLGAQEASAASAETQVKLTVGEEEDNCTLYIDKSTGRYYLGKTNASGPSINISKHLIECYNGLTLYEFNYDYVMGLKLFDPSVVAYQLILAALDMRVTSRISMNVNFDSNDYSFYNSTQRIEQILKKIIESGDEEYTDCFYTFSNDDFIDMLSQSEERRYNNLPYENSEKLINLDDVASILEGIGSQGTLMEQKYAISNAIEKTFAIIADNNNDIAKRDAYKVKFDFATNMLTKLALVLLESLITPKVLMIIGVNKILMGNNSEDITTEDLLKGAQGLIIGIIKELRDLIIKKLLDYVLDYLSPMAFEIEGKLEAEQYQCYIDLIRSLLAMLNKASKYRKRLDSIFSNLNKKASGNYDLPTVLDAVNYADIIEEEILNESNDTPKNNC